MQTAPILAWRNLEPSDVVVAIVMRRVARLESIHPRLIGIEVTLEAPQKRQVSGRILQVRLRIRLPGDDLHSDRASAQGSARDDLLLAVNRAFSSAERVLKRHKKIHARIEVKDHPPVLHGEISLLEQELGHGLIRADDGREVYFQRDGLTADIWDKLRPGDRLRFREMQGDKGPYAVSVSRP